MPDHIKTQFFIKFYFATILIILTLLSCKSLNTTNRVATITLEKLDFTASDLEQINSIRSIEIIQDKVFFIASKGIIYGFEKEQKLVPYDFFKEEKPNFRASGHAGEYLYTLSIENPALLYQFKIDKKGLEIPKLVYNEEGKKVFYDALTFFNSKDGIAIGDPTEDCLSIILTEDGGNTWSKIPCTSLPKLVDGEAAFAASNTNIATIKNNAWIITGGKKSRVLSTKDKGKTWKISETPLIQGKGSTGGYSITFYDKDNGIICGGDYTNKSGNSKNKAITKDGGNTWQLVSENLDPGYISCVQYVPNTNGRELFAVSTEGIYYSNNTGISWEKVHDEGYYTIRFIDKHTAWLAGNGKIAKMYID